MDKRSMSSSPRPLQIEKKPGIGDVWVGFRWGVAAGLSKSINAPHAQKRTTSAATFALLKLIDLTTVPASIHLSCRSATDSVAGNGMIC